MKPIELEISAWGPYKQLEKLQFERLWARGLFLVTGPTGAGKTTVFDAICFALYGTLSGQMREKNSVRSDFADKDTKTYVKLKMEHKGQLYEIYRNPEYLRPKKRRNGTEEWTKERENAILTMPDSSCIEGAGEVTRKIQEILALDYVQFKQISMIAQGEFAKLLTESPGEKIKIFRKLFGTAVVEQFAANLRNKSGKLYKEVMEYRHRMDEDVKLLHEDSEEWKNLLDNPDRSYEAVFRYLEVLLKEDKERKKTADKAYEKADKEEKELALKKAELERVKETTARLEKQKERLSLCKAEKEKYEKKEKEAEQIRRAQLVEPAYIQLSNKREQKEKLEKKLIDLQKEMQTLETRLQENLFFYQNKDTLLALLSVEKEKKECEEEKQKSLTLWKEKQDELEKLKGEYVLAEEKVRERRERLEQAEEFYRRSAIGIAVKMLEKGKPCPVCGSTEHPKPAEKTENGIDEKTLKKLREQYETENQKMLQVHEQALLKQAEGTALEKERKKNEEKLERILQEERKQEEQICWGDRDSTEFFKNTDRKKEELEERATAYQKAQILLTEKKAEKGRVSMELTEMSETVTDLTNAYKQALFENHLMDEQTFFSYRERKEEEDVLREECRQYQEELQTLTNLVNHLQEEVNSYERIKEEPAESDELEEKLALCRQEKTNRNKERERTGQRILEIKKILQTLKEKQESMESLSREYGIVKDLDNLASGNNAKRLVFEQYVLAAYFEQVLEAANVRFEKMTAGRYTMFRSEEVSDGRSKDSMEICVMDYYTGKARPVKTLSGGETFKASLSLALGLSDVIGRTNGGIRVETLFIDEGFGALDSESLEQACEALTSLVEKDRLIGIISHVPELRERIDNQVVIRKTNSGSRIENMVG